MWGSLKNQDGCGSRAFRCCWTRQTCSLLKTDLRGLPVAVASITWLAATREGRALVMPSGVDPDCAVAKVFGPCCPRGQQGSVRRMSCRITFPGTKEISELLLTASAQSCYKERVQTGAMPINTAKRSQGQRVP